MLFVRQSYLGIDATVQVVEAPKYRVSCIRNTDRYESSTHFALSWLVSCNGMHDYERCQNFWCMEVEKKGNYATKDSDAANCY